MTLPASCEFRGDAADSCAAVFHCSNSQAPADFCATSPRSFALICRARPHMAPAALGKIVHVCSACTHRAPLPQIGSRLAALISERVGATGCSACQMRLADLDRLTPDEVESRLPELSREIAERAKRQAPKWWQRQAAAAVPVAAAAIVRRWIQEAIDQARAAPGE